MTKITHLVYKSMFLPQICATITTTLEHFHYLKKEILCPLATECYPSHQIYTTTRLLIYMVSFAYSEHFT